MVETVDRLAKVRLNGRLLSFSHGVLIHALLGWHVALYQVPVRARGGKSGRLVVETTAGGRLVGDVVTEFATANGECLLLTGVGLLRLEGSTRAA